MYKVSQDTLKIKIKHCYVVTLTGEAIRCHTLPKGDLGATTAKRQLLYVSRRKTQSQVVVLSHTPRKLSQLLQYLNQDCIKPNHKRSKY